METKKLNQELLMKNMYGYRSDYRRGMAQRNGVVNIDQLNTLVDKRIGLRDNCFSNYLLFKNKLLGERLIVINLYFVMFCFTTSFLFLSAFTATFTFFLLPVEGIVLEQLTTKMIRNTCTANIGGEQAH